METLLAAIGIGLLLGIVYVIYRVRDIQGNGDDKIMLEYIEALRKEVRESGTESRKENQALLDRMQDRLSKGLQLSHESNQKQFVQSAKIIKEVTEKLTQLDETNKQVKDFAGQMQSLENILKNPKQRGILGEYFLETLLGHTLQPGQYKMQYKFSNGEIVDAVVFQKDDIIPIDAKFSLEKYNRIMEMNDGPEKEKTEREFKQDLKNRIDETAKYIRPNENTTDFAFMFIPAEGVYHSLLVYKVGASSINSIDLIEYAFRKHVIIVSPTTFFAYLQTVLQGLKALKMEESVKDIIKKIGELGRHMGSYEEYMQKMGKNLGTTVNMYNSAYKEFNKIDKDIYKITEGEEGGKADPLQIEKPTLEV